MNESPLTSYIQEQLSSGFPLQEIKDALIQVGWQTTQIEAALLELKPVATESNISRRSHHSPLLIICVLAIAIFLVGTSGSIALAEQGYLPQFSKLYRQTDLPLLWHGTTADPGITVLQAIHSITQSPNITEAVTLALSVQAANPNGSEESALNQYLPLTLGITDMTHTDGNLNLSSSDVIDFGNSFEKIASLSKSLPTLKKQNTFEVSIVPSQQKMYVRSSLIPYQNGDSTKWLAFALPQGSQTNLSTLQQQATKLSKQQIADYEDLMKSALTDQGIVRINNRPYAKYQLVVDQNLITRLNAYPHLAQYRSYFQQLIASGISSNTIILVDPQTGQPMQLVSDTSGEPSGSNIKISTHLTLDISYDKKSTVIIPSTDQIIPNGEAYLSSIEESFFSNPAS